MRTISISKWAASAAAIVLSSFATFAQVNRTLGTLPPGGTVTITFDVTINTPFPANTSSVTNQGILSGTGFGPVLTDDPATGTANDPTVTAVTVAPQISCPANITTNALSACLLPSVAFGATVTAGFPAPAITYKLGATVINSPYTFPAGTNMVTVTATNGTTPNAACSFTVTVTAVANPPQLNIARINTNVVLSWPGNYSCYSLQVSPVLLPPPATNVWTPYPGPFTTINGNIYVTNGLTSSNRFFRLAY